MRKGYLVWWCGGHEDERGAPDIQDDSYIAGLVVICSGCGRVAPDQNGCRWRHEAELKITHQDVDLVRDLVDFEAGRQEYLVAGEVSRLRSLADRIEALLPPKEPT